MLLAQVDLVSSYNLADMEDVSLSNLAEAGLDEGEEHFADWVCWEQGATTSHQDTVNMVPGNLVFETVSLVALNGRQSTR